MVPAWTRDANDPDILELARFVLFAECSNPQCRQVGAASRDFLTTSSIIIDLKTESEEPEQVHEIAALHPSPPMIGIPANVDDAVRVDLMNAFTAYWSDREGFWSSRASPPSRNASPGNTFYRLRRDSPLLPLVSRRLFLGGECYGGGSKTSNCV